MALIIEPFSLTVFSFDLIEEESARHNVEWTSFPVESGLNISDHAIIEPDELELHGLVTDYPMTGVPTPQRALRAYEALRTLRERRRLVTVVSGLGVFADMGIVSVSTKRDANTGEALPAVVVLRKVRLVASVSVPVPTEILAPKALSAATPVSLPSVHAQLDIEQMSAGENGGLLMGDAGGAMGTSYFPRPGEPDLLDGTGYANSWHSL